MLGHQPTRLITLPVALAFLLHVLFATVAAQEATPTLVVQDSATIVEALVTAESPADLPGNDDATIALRTWEEMYGEPLKNVAGAWLLTGSPELPLATIIVFDSGEDAQTGIAEYRRDSSTFSIGERDAWTVADRGKWICMTAEGPMVVIGQALPVDTDEPEDDVERRACAVLESTLDWLHHTVLGESGATPPASPTA